MKQFLSILALLFAAGNGVNAQSSLPAIEVEDVESFRSHCRDLLHALDQLKVHLPEQTAKPLRAFVENRQENSQAAVEKIQKLLDGRCLVGVSINPESRVKAARGPLPADLTQGQETIVLIRVQNDAGVTHPLMIGGAQVRSAKESDKERWLEIVLHRAPPLTDKLTGRKVEYLIVGLAPHQGGKREVTLKFDVGQGTQDLGFRAEVPILFTIKPRDSSPKR